MARNQHVNSFLTTALIGRMLLLIWLTVPAYRFDIDSLVNKIRERSFVHQTFVKYLYGPCENNWSLIKSKTTLVIKSIESGCLLHVLSRKTVYFKEGNRLVK
ncbi:RNA_pol_Rpb2_6 domain-containing protein [Nephila pilipes]|uniref:RNA_pol_Rpb2_6 domain-containing protein n=1 Tax=Nephila pilipes TaxID=299642 RepID=A0A8X6J047_NEPPI|nr:RNA_pol_Rpb2_6 domain-containing protein [Nephila pilipes]